ncbi:prolyl oligopeptidase family serine peptidase [Pararoseomonas sp. SCSIO 73927]|uniref:prolyl oligopeptidase family serine peptidase n=1 Tax=Pararoseomonas sp. SCSIO 73927 TaxID=3114537 RepID=UPI0030D3EB84
MDYPETRRVDAVEERFGVRVADPYRWLESDARTDPEVAAWAAAQDRLARSYLAGLPGRDAFRERLAALVDHERLTPPEKRGNRYFFTRNPGLDNQDVLVLREGVDGPDRVLIDPNSWSEDGATALAEWSASPDGAHVAFAVQEGGTDWRTIRVLDVASGAWLEDRLEWARFTALAWVGDGSGFLYSRFPAPQGPAGFEARVMGHAVYFHAIGTPQAEDRAVHATPDRPDHLNLASVTADGRYAAILSMPGPGGNALTVLDLADSAWTPFRLVERTDVAWSVIGNLGTTLYLLTQQDAPRGKVVALDLDRVGAGPRDLVPEREEVLVDAALVGGRLLLSYLVDGRTRILRHRPDGTPDGEVGLPGLGTAGGFRGHPGDDEAFLVFTSHDAPTTVLRYDVPANRWTVWARPEVAIDLGRIAVEQRFYRSKDGTRVPLVIVRRKDVAGPAPTVLYGYGGFGISMVPYYSPAHLAWVEQGGVYAVAGLRGGGEYGKAWHDAGRLLNKENVLDDFIAAGEYLKAEGVTAPGGLAIQGESNGGLLVGAVVNRRPDLFAAALPGVGVMDMLRFHRFTGGGFWQQDYGDPEREADFRNLLSLSPYHNVREGVAYPAVLVTTADTDDRVVPGHSFKYAAALQAGDLGDRPRLLRIDVRAGHGAGKPIDKGIEEVADLWAFAARWTGLEVRPGG